MLRVIARLDVKPPFVVKPVHFEGLRKVGDPLTLAKEYYDQGADEIVYLDIVSSLYQREIIYNDIINSSRSIYIPFAAGGGITNVDECIKLIRGGVDKVIMNTAAIKNPELIEKTAKICGSQAVLIHIEAKKWADHWECYTDCGRNRTGKNVLEWAKEVEDIGAGEIMISSVDCDGRKKGYDIDLIEKVVSNAKIPIIAGSGAGSLEDILNVAKQAKPDAIAIATLLHYKIHSISEIKRFLYENGIEVMI